MLNTQQQEAMNAIKHWITHEIFKKPIFTLAGYAGTGKTFLINYLVENVLEIDPNKVAFATPTGKAASILIQKGLVNACTVHKLIYVAKESEELNDKGKHKTIFVKKESIPDYELIILDEVSMVSKKMIEDILSFHIPVLACGDPGQLPPVMAENHDLLLHPDYTLTEIVRQAENNPIIQLSKMAREDKFIPCGKYGDSVIVIKRDQIKEDELKTILYRADQVICGKNDTRVELNNFMRKKIFNKTSDLPEDGDKIICCMNNYEIELDDEGLFPLVNGLIGTVKNFKIQNEKEGISTLDFKSDFLNSYTEDIACDTDGFDKDEFRYDRHQRVYKLLEDKYTIMRSLFTKAKKDNVEEYEKYKEDINEELRNRKNAVDEKQIAQFLFGYCISVHKAQGSEWNKVVVFDESDSFMSYRSKWLYTAITRAKKKLIIIKK